MTLDLLRYSFTAADFDRMIEAGILDESTRVELIEGEIVAMTPTGRRHAACVDRLTRLLGASIEDSAQLRVQGPIHLGQASEFQPDLALLRRSGDFYASAHPTARDVLLVVEVGESSVAVDRQVKIPLYARFGIAEAWLVDLEANLLTVYRDPTPTGYATVLEAKRGTRLMAPAVGGREIAVSDILR